MSKPLLLYRRKALTDKALPSQNSQKILHLIYFMLCLNFDTELQINQEHTSALKGRSWTVLIELTFTERNK